MKKLALLMATFVLAACGNGKNTSPTGDVNGDGTCTQRYIDASNEFNHTNPKTAENCEAFKANHGTVNCTATKVWTGEKTTASYQAQFADICEPLIAAKKGKDAAVAGPSTPKPAASAPTDELLVKDLNPAWVKVEFTTRRMTSLTGDNQALVVLNGSVIYFTDYLAWESKVSINEIYTVCSIKGFTTSDAFNPLTPRTIKHDPVSKAVELTFGEKKMSCETKKANNTMFDTTVGHLKKTFSSIAKIEVLRN